MELALKRIRAAPRSSSEYMPRKTPVSDPEFLRSVTAAPHIRVKRIPVNSVELTERSLKTGCPALGGEQHYTPASRMKSVLIVP